MTGKLTSWAVIGMCAVVALGSGLAVVASYQVRTQARTALEGQVRLFSAREHVALAQEALGDADIEDALIGATQANEAAERVSLVTRRIVKLLRPTTRTAGVIAASARTALRGARFARRQTEVAAQVLGAISGYQSAARDYSSSTNRALRRIIAALRETNATFPLSQLPEFP